MNLFKKVIWCFLVLYIKDLAESSDFHYPHLNEKENWGGMCNSGAKQSPINLDPSIALMAHFKKLSLMNYDRDVETNVTNNGHSLQVAFGPQFGIKMVAGGLGGMYVLDQMHFHWGSEHTLDGRRYGLELHLVHHDERFSSIQDAVGSPNGLAVLGVLFHVSEDSSKVLDQILDSSESIKKRASAVTRMESPINPAHFLPPNTDKFYRYDGSLTTPGCNEAVVWTVFEKSMPISKLQLERFREMRSTDGSPLKYNYRPLQPLGDRMIFYHDIENPRMPTSGSVPTLISNTLTIGAAILTIFTSTTFI